MSSTLFSVRSKLGVFLIEDVQVDRRLWHK
jgi:hypothetical protein